MLGFTSPGTQFYQIPSKSPPPLLKSSPARPLPLPLRPCHGHGDPEIHARRVLPQLAFPEQQVQGLNICFCPLPPIPTCSTSLSSPCPPCVSLYPPCALLCCALLCCVVLHGRTGLHYTALRCSRCYNHGGGGSRARVLDADPPPPPWGVIGISVGDVGAKDAGEKKTLATGGDRSIFSPYVSVLKILRI